MSNDEFDEGSDSGGESTVDPSTMRGRSWPCLRQFCVFLENRVGNLHDFLRDVERFDLRVIGLSIIDSSDSAIVRVIFADVDRARELLDLSGHTVFEVDVVGVTLPDDPQPFLSVCGAMLEAELNIQYTYPLLYRRNGRGAIALHVDDVDLALQSLQEQGHTVITESDLLNDDEFF